MTIEYITAHEADQQIRLKQPLAWPIYSTFAHCSGPCHQGRSVCLTPEACQTGQHSDDEWPEREPMTAADALLALALCAGCWGVVAAVYVAVWGL